MTWRYTLIILSLGLMLFADQLAAREVKKLGSSYINGWAGSRYVATGKSPDAIVDDVYALYWNPAGLAEIKNKKNLSVENRQKSAPPVDSGEPSLDDLTRFSNEKQVDGTVQFGISGTPNLNGWAGFAGMAGTLFDGVVGIGYYGFEARHTGLYDDEDLLIKKVNYASTAASCAYGWKIGITNFGITAKYLREEVDTDHYEAGAVDFGTQVEPLPFVRIGFVVQDVGHGFRHDEGIEQLDTAKLFGAPVMRMSLALLPPTSDFVIVASASKKIEVNDYEFGAGLEYTVSSHISIYAGYHSRFMTAGFMLRNATVELSYAYAYDPINYGNTHVVSVTGSF